MSKVRRWNRALSSLQADYCTDDNHGEPTSNRYNQGESIGTSVDRGQHNPEATIAEPQSL